MIYVRDVTCGILQAGGTEQAICKVYLLVSDKSTSQSGYFNNIAREPGIPPTELYIPYTLSLALSGGQFGDGELSHGLWHDVDRQGKSLSDRPGTSRVELLIPGSPR